jgi:hypothetical protein
VVSTEVATTGVRASTPSTAASTIIQPQNLLSAFERNATTTASRQPAVQPSSTQSALRPRNLLSSLLTTTVSRQSAVQPSSAQSAIQPKNLLSSFATIKKETPSPSFAYIEMSDVEKKEVELQRKALKQAMLPQFEQQMEDAVRFGLDFPGFLKKNYPENVKEYEEGKLMRTASRMDPWEKMYDKARLEHELMRLGDTNLTDPDQVRKRFMYEKNVPESTRLFKHRGKEVVLYTDKYGEHHFITQSGKVISEKVNPDDAAVYRKTYEKAKDPVSVTEEEEYLINQQVAKARSMTAPVIRAQNQNSRIKQFLSNFMGVSGVVGNTYMNIARSIDPRETVKKTDTTENDMSFEYFHSLSPDEREEVLSSADYGGYTDEYQAGYRAWKKRNNIPETIIQEEKSNSIPETISKDEKPNNIPETIQKDRTPPNYTTVLTPGFLSTLESAQKRKTQNQADLNDAESKRQYIKNFLRSNANRITSSNVNDTKLVEMAAQNSAADNSKAVSFDSVTTKFVTPRNQRQYSATTPYSGKGDYDSRMAGDTPYLKKYINEYWDYFDEMESNNQQSASSSRPQDIQPFINPYNSPSQESDNQQSSRSLIADSASNENPNSLSSFDSIESGTNEEQMTEGTQFDFSGYENPNIASEYAAFNVNFNKR